jgi:preprotein translocase subunit SecA
MIDKVLTAIFGSQHERDVKRMLPIVAEINALEPEIKSLTDDQLREKTQQFRERLIPFVEAIDTAKREVPRDENAVAAARQDLQDALDELLPEAFAVAREGGKRILIAAKSPR